MSTKPTDFERYLAACHNAHGKWKPLTPEEKQGAYALIGAIVALAIVAFVFGR